MQKKQDTYVFKIIHNRCDSLFRRVYEIRYDASSYLCQ